MRKQTANGILRFNTARVSALCDISGFFAVSEYMVAAPPMLS
jgi:hypothetical protein